MSEYTAIVRWSRGQQDFIDNSYSRGHTWTFDGGLSVAASSSPDVVPLPMSVAEHVDPEEAFVASLSSCHMLFFLSLAAQRGIMVDEYTDASVGFLEKDDNGNMAMTRVILRPNCEYGTALAPDAETILRLHHRAHKLCFIANSVKTEVVTEIIA
jgi:organic hydroperoxide reductase OsmC/OhrA